ncbi:MAG: methylmalonyl-CoA carboxyltransferase [Rhodospirillaceae bacterium]|jgi:acetyl-CoA carboxylase carboxyltransferase component|nr:methylmalonyl-CoA carboxyltransferase [Rhodospirillaceae bacterium]MBT4689254.1 methylmalonyl-CoA carboxyltransferase [Rhodospirillaceae bacterium]MBT5079327.1 methylmalonyl-CoA carboxyltransferase [Rhodospirillaceae bacterium]MBT5525803.1 methylmalonyl-CoA carboxyltransferase [Rhodospirillaceae bacterium]MBT5880174.1 methylmalonyl-CoA carboxyltransferase [Rhodospirillaceae bacterium]
MDWQEEKDELVKRNALAQNLGGADKIERQHKGGRLTVRERIDQILDPDSFQEIGALAGAFGYDESGNIVEHSPTNCVMGRGRINGQPIVISGDDFTVRGGSADATIWEKAKYPETMANELRLPIVRLIEGSGGGGSVKTIETKGRANLPGGLGNTSGFDILAENMATVPVVGLGLGSVAGLGAARLAASHYSVLVKDIGAMFVAGPPVVKHIGEDLDKQELGGHAIQTAAGGVDHAADSEEDAFECARQFLSYMPPSIYDLPPRGEQLDDSSRQDEMLDSIIPKNTRKVYRMRKIINSLVDQNSFFEMGKMFGRSIITGLARLDGWPVAIIASDPHFYGGAWTSDACDKIIRFVDMAETFHLPVVYLADCPGFLVGGEAERTGVIRHGVRAMTSINQSTVPWCSIIIRNSFGVAGGAHRPVGRYSVRYAWYTGRWGSLPLEGGIEAAYRADLDAADDPVAKLKEIEERLNRLRSPYRTAEVFWIEDIIEPHKTRPLLCDFANLAAPLRTPGPVSFGMRP